MSSLFDDDSEPHFHVCEFSRELRRGHGVLPTGEKSKAKVAGRDHGFSVDFDSIDSRILRQMAELNFGGS